MIVPPNLTTERLSLEPLSQQHSTGMYRLWSQEAVCRYSGPAVDRSGEPIRLPAVDPADSDKIIDFFVRLAAAGRGFRWALLAGDGRAFAGAIGFNALSPRAELAFHLHPEFWGKGLMREAAEAALGWVRGDRPDVEVEAFIEPENGASIALATRLGFRPTGSFQGGAQGYLLRPWTVPQDHLPGTT